MSDRQIVLRYVTCHHNFLITSLVFIITFSYWNILIWRSHIAQEKPWMIIKRRCWMNMFVQKNNFEFYKTLDLTITIHFYFTFLCTLVRARLAEVKWQQISFAGNIDCLSNFEKIVSTWVFIIKYEGDILELVSKELNHFGVIADLFRQIGGHSSRFVLFCSLWRLFTIKMIKSVKVFPLSFLKIITFFFYFIKFKPPA